MRTDFDAVIVGAGPAGAAASILLARAGWSVALVEKQPFPRRKVCGECVAASNLPLLDALGVGDAFELRAGPPLRHVALMRGARTVVAALPPVAGSAHAWGRALGRETLDTLLVGAARRAGAHVFQPWSAQAVDGAPGAWRCTVRPVGAGPGSLVLRAPLAIAAHGSWEALPSGRARRRGDRGPADLLAFKANFTGAELADGLLPVLAFAGGYGGMVVADGGVTTLAACVRRDTLEAWRRALPGVPAGEAVEAMLRRACDGVGAALRHARRAGPWLAAGPLDPGVRLRADDRLLRIGNAAGEAHPIIGEGMSMALQSAWLLCAELLAPADDDAAAAPALDAPWASDPRTRDAADRRSMATRVDASAPRDGDPRGPVTQRDGDPRSPARQRVVARRYAHAWRRTFAPRLRLAALFAHVAMRPASSALLITLTARWPGLLTRGARWGGKVDTSCTAATMAALQSPGADRPDTPPPQPHGAARRSLRKTT
jgi:2-polyprenyl-6-methoxyphenol hydroxylase-like FAD-dependent oxidoreductase